MSGFFGLFGCFKGKNTGGDKPNTVADPAAAQSGGRRVVPTTAALDEEQAAFCSNCKRPLEGGSSARNDK